MSNSSLSRPLESESISQSETDDLRHCGFLLNDQQYALKVLHVQEFIRPHLITPVPLAPHFVEGLINLRGQVVTCINLHRLFGVKTSSKSEFMKIIVNSSQGLYALMVDEILDVFELQPDKSEKTPSHINPEYSIYFSSLYRENDELILILNLDELLNKLTEGNKL